MVILYRLYLLVYIFGYQMLYNSKYFFNLERDFSITAKISVVVFAGVKGSSS